MDENLTGTSQESNLPNNSMELDGYAFKSRSDFERALKERDTIEKIKAGINPENLDSIKSMYIRLTSKNYFSTPIGIGFLRDMQKYLIENGEDTALIPVPKSKVLKEKSDEVTDSSYLDSLLAENNKIRRIKSKLIIAVVALTFTVVAMIFMVMTNDNLGYYKAEEKVLDKYSAWEEELKSREKALDEREDELNGISKIEK